MNKGTVVFNLSGHGIVISTNGKLLMTLEVKGREVVENRNVKSLHVGMWLQGSEQLAVKLSPERDLESVKGEMLDQKDIKMTFTFIDMALNANYDDNARARAVRIASTLMEEMSDEAFEKIRTVMLQIEMPNEGCETRSLEFTGRAAEMFAEVIKKYGHRPDYNVH